MKSCQAGKTIAARGWHRDREEDEIEKQLLTGSMEKKGLGDKTYRLEQEALFSSGIRDQEALRFYTAKLDFLFEQFLPQIKLPVDPIAGARALFDWLWEQKPNRYERHGHFRLSEVIDAQADQGDHPVGNCLGLTLLYHCLLRRVGIHAEAVHLENAFGTAPHVLTLLQEETLLMDIENILPEGFDYKGHLQNPSRTRWGDKELISDIYHSLGNEALERENWTGALRNYEMAIRLNPRYEKAYLNRTMLMDKLRMGS